MADNETDFDVRVVERNISQGVVSEQDYKKHLKELKDASENAEFVPIDEEEGGQPEPETASEQTLSEQTLSEQAGAGKGK